MTTIGSIVTKALVKARASSKYNYEEQDAQILPICNSILRTIYSGLKAVESNMVYAIQSFSCVASTQEYTPSSSFDDILRVWLTDDDGTVFDLSEVDEELKTQFDLVNVTARPQYYYLTEDGKMGMLDIPDDNYTVYILYHPPLTELTALTGAGSTVPWKDLWNNYIEVAIVVELLEIQERPSQLRLAEKAIEWDQAMGATLKLGTRRKYQIDEMFQNIQDDQIEE